MDSIDSHDLQERNESSPQGPLSSEEDIRMAALQRLPWHRRPSIPWLLSFVFIITVVVTISAAPQEQMIITIVCKDHFQGSPPGYDCSSREVQALAAVVMSRLGSIKAIITVLTMGFYTAQSDRLGRKFLLYLTLFTCFCTQVLLIIMGQPDNHWSLSLLYCNSFLAGCLGGTADMLTPAVVSYIADCTRSDKRSISIGYVMTSMAVGMIIGPVLGAYIIEMTKNTSTALIVSVVGLVFLSLYAILIPESCPQVLNLLNKDEALQNKQDEQRAPLSVLGVAKQSLKDILDSVLLFIPGRIKPHAGTEVLSKYSLLFLVCANTLVEFTARGIRAVFIPYSNMKYGWTTKEDGIYFTFSGAAMLVVYVVIFPAMQAVFQYVTKGRRGEDSRSAQVSNGSSDIPNETEHTPLLQEEGVPNAHTTEESVTQAGSNAGDIIRRDLTFIVLGTMLFLLSHIIVPAFDTPTILFISVAVNNLATTGSASFMSLLTSVAPTEHTGKIVGGISVIEAVATATSSLVYGWIFARTSVTEPSTVYMVSGALCSCSFVVVVAVWYTSRRKRT